MFCVVSCMTSRIVPNPNIAIKTGTFGKTSHVSREGFDGLIKCFSDVPV